MRIAGCGSRNGGTNLEARGPSADFVGFVRELEPCESRPRDAIPPGMILDCLKHSSSRSPLKLIGEPLRLPAKTTSIVMEPELPAAMNSTA